MSVMHKNHISALDILELFEFDHLHFMLFCVSSTT